MQSGAWAGIQIGPEFQDKRNAKQPPMINLQVIDHPNSGQPILNCFDYEHFKNITDDHTHVTEQALFNQ